MSRSFCSELSVNEYMDLHIVWNPELVPFRTRNITLATNLIISLAASKILITTYWADTGGMRAKRRQECEDLHTLAMTM